MAFFVGHRSRLAASYKEKYAVVALGANSTIFAHAIFIDLQSVTNNNCAVYSA